MGMQYDYNNGGFNPRQSGSTAGQVYYDESTGQYYTQPSQSNLMSNLFGGMRDKTQQRNYLTNNQSMVAQPRVPHNYIDIAALYPELMQGAQGMQGDYQAGNLLGGAAQSASSGAGRFL